MTQGTPGPTAGPSCHRGPLPAGNARWESSLLLAVLLLPRLARMAWPEVWLEDADYMHAALLISRGFVPFVDFPSPHVPLLEAILGAVYLLTGPSLRAAEVLTQAAIVLAAWVLYRIVRDRAGSHVALLAAAVYGCSSLVFRYHLFEREIFTNLLLAAGLLLVLDERRRGRRLLVLLVPVALGAALVKFTALVDWAGVGIFMLIQRERRVDAARFALWLVLSLLAVVAAGITIFGDAFIAQAFLLHLMKGGTGTVAGHLTVLRQSLDLTGVLGIGGLAVMVARSGRGRGAAGAEMRLLALLLGLRLVFFLFLSPTFWPHNALTLLIPLSWAAGEFAVWAGRSVFDAVGREGWGWLPRSAGIAGFMFAGLLLFPPRNAQWRLGSVFGFGYQDRGELREIADSVRDHSGRDERIIAPPHVAVDSGRVKLVHYREVAGPVSVIEDALDAGEIAKLRERLKDRDFFEYLFASAQVVGEEITRSIVERSVAVVVPDSRFSLVSETRVREPFLQEHGYREALATENYSVWVLADRDRTRPTR